MPSSSQRLRLATKGRRQVENSTLRSVGITAIKPFVQRVPPFPTLSVSIVYVCNPCARLAAAAAAAAAAATAASPLARYGTTPYLRSPEITAVRAITLSVDLNFLLNGVYALGLILLFLNIFGQVYLYVYVNTREI